MILYLSVGAAAFTCALAIVDGDNGFAYPGYAGPFDNVLWEIGTSRPLKWYTTLNEYNITLWQTNPVSLIGTIYQTSNGNGAGNQSYQWQVQPLGASLSVSPNFFLWGGPHETSSSGFTSYSFNMTYSQTTSSSSSSTNTPTSTMPTTPNTAPSMASPTPLPLNTASPNYDDGTAFKIGLGVGLGVGIPVVLMVGLWIGISLQKRSKPKSDFNGHPTPWLQEHKHGLHSPSQRNVHYHFAPNSQEIHEAAGATSPTELSHEAAKSSTRAEMEG